MFRNLNAEQARFDMNNQQVADYLNVTRKTYETKKSSGSFTLSEIKKLCKLFSVQFEYLFETADEREGK